MHGAQSDEGRPDCPAFSYRFIRTSLGSTDMPKQFQRFTISFVPESTVRYGGESRYIGRRSGGRPTEVEGSADVRWSELLGLTPSASQAT